MNDKEFGSLKLLKLNYRRRNQTIQTFYKIGSRRNPPSPLFDLQNFQDSEKITPESCRMHWNLNNEKDLFSVKLLKLKYRRGIFYRIDSPQKLGPLSLICRNFKSLRKLLVNHTECIDILWITKNLRTWVINLGKPKYRWGDQIIQTFCRIGSAQKLGPMPLIWRNFKSLRKVPLNQAESLVI